MKTRITLLTFLSFVLMFSANAQNTIQSSFMSGGLLREYRMYVPAIYTPNKAVPLLINIHGYGSNFMEQEVYADFRPIADTANFIVVHPNGTLDFQNKRNWNSFGISTVDDLGFIAALIDSISAHYNIDPNRIYSTGMSNGGFFSYDLACSLSPRIAAVASVAGTMVQAHKNACSPTHPMPVMHIHGTADGTVPYNGNFAFLPADSIVQYWVNFNHTSKTPTVIPVPNTNTTDGSTAERIIYANGNAGSTVEFYKITGGGHSWPGAPININSTNMDFSASKEIWRFLRKYRLNTLTGIEEPEIEPEAVNVFPNPAQANFTVTFPDFSAKIVTVSDFSGKEIQQFKTSENQVKIHLKTEGLYFVKVQTNDKVAVKRIVNF